LKVGDLKRAELRGKLSSFDADFAYWVATSTPSTEQPRPRLEKHVSQIERLGNALAAERDIIESKLDALTSPESVVAACTQLEIDILDLHRVWGFFRRKFALRLVPRFFDFLEALDELAFHCYRRAVNPAIAAQTLRPEAVKEPPLVYFEDSTIPSAVTRSSKSYLYDAGRHVPKAAGLLAMMNAMPFPVIGVPWSQVHHLPSALMLAHEVGHCIERDLALDSALKAWIDGSVAAQRAPAWRAWQSEVFADVFATLALGPTFAHSLVALLAKDAATIEKETRTSAAYGEYPTASLRVALVCTVLEQEKHSAAAGEILQDWNLAYRKSALSDFKPDILNLVTGLREQSPVLSKLASALRFTPQDQQAAERASNVMLSPIAGTPVGDVRQLFASAAHAFQQNPDQHAKREIDQTVVRTVLEQRAVGVRSVVSGPVVPRGKQKDRDQAEATNFFASLRAARALAERPGEDTSETEPDPELLG